MEELSDGLRTGEGEGMISLARIMWKSKNSRALKAELVAYWAIQSAVRDTKTQFSANDKLR